MKAPEDIPDSIRELYEKIIKEEMSGKLYLHDDYHWIACHMLVSLVMERYRYEKM